MKIVPYEEKWCTSILALWNKELGETFPMRKKLFIQNSLEDRNLFFEGSFVAVDDSGETAGFIIAKVWNETFNLYPSIGWIQCIIIGSAYRHDGLGTKLYQSAEHAFRKNGIEKVLLGRDPYDYFPGIPEESASAKKWAEKQGFVYEGKDYDMLRIFAQDEEAYFPSVEGYEFTILTEDEKEQLLHFLHESFPGRWEYETIQYFEKGGTGREFVVIKKSGAIVGFCRVNDATSPIIAQNVYWAPMFNSQELGGIGPLGIDAKERKKGLGLAVVEAGIHTLKERGMDAIVIDWTGLIDFYEKLQFKPWKTYMKFTKQL